MMLLQPSNHGISLHAVYAIVSSSDAKTKQMRITIDTQVKTILQLFALQDTKLSLLKVC